MRGRAERGGRREGRGEREGRRGTGRDSLKRAGAHALSHTHKGRGAEGVSGKHACLDLICLMIDLHPGARRREVLHNGPHGMQLVKGHGSVGVAGSPLGLFLALRKVNPSKGRGLGTRAAASLMLGARGQGAGGDGLPAVNRMYNLYHPFDPVGYR